MSFHNALWKAALAAKRLIRTRPSWSHKLKRDSSEKATWCQSACQALCSWAHCKRCHLWFAVRGVGYKGTLARSPRCSRHQSIGEDDNSIPVAVNRRFANFLEKTLLWFTAMQSRCRSLCADVIFCRLMTIFQVFRCWSVNWFQTRITVKLFCCTQFSYSLIETSFFSKANNPPTFKLHKLLKFLLFPTWRHS